MTSKTDNLLGLFTICTGYVALTGNYHKDDNKTVQEWIHGYRHAHEITAEEKAEMVELDQVITIDFWLDRFGERYTCFGGSVEAAATRAFERAKVLTEKTDFTFMLGKINLTEAVELLVKICAKSVDLEYNQYKSTNWGYHGTQGEDRTAADYLAFLKDTDPEDFVPDADGDVVFTQEVCEKMVETGEVFELRIYPHTTIGSYSYLHHDIGFIVYGALVTVKDENLLSGGDVEQNRALFQAIKNLEVNPAVNTVGFDNVNLNGGWKP